MKLSIGREESAVTNDSCADRLVRHVTLRQLQILEAIVQQGSFTRAAEQLFLTQPTVSMQVKKLADVMGVPLFQQVGRRVEPTDAGREVYAAARDILRSLADLDVRLADLKGLRRGRLRLAVITAAKYFAPEILGAFCERYPNIEVSLKVTNRERVIESVVASDDDIFIMGRSEGIGVEVESIDFAPNPLVVIARHDHPLAGERAIPLKRLTEERFLLREPGSGIRDAVLKAFSKEGLCPNVSMELGSNEAIKHAVLGGLGIATLSLHSLALDAESGKIALLNVDGFPIMRSWYLVYPRHRELSLVGKAFLSFTIEHGDEIGQRLDETLRKFEQLRHATETRSS